MKVKINIDLDFEQVKKIHLENLKKMLECTRNKFTCLRAGNIFQKGEIANNETQYLFAKLYKLLGFKNRFIKKYDERIILYLSEVKLLWDDYYNNLNHNIIPDEFTDYYKGKVFENYYEMQAIQNAKYKYNELKGKMFIKSSINKNIKEIVKHLENENYYEFMIAALKQRETNYSLNYIYDTKIKYLDKLKVKI